MRGERIWSTYWKGVEVHEGDGYEGCGHERLEDGASKKCRRPRTAVHGARSAGSPVEDDADWVDRGGMLPPAATLGRQPRMQPVFLRAPSWCGHQPSEQDPTARERPSPRW